MRLVVDTGLHDQGWSREQAIRYMQDNSSIAATETEAEVERYIVVPGQALGPRFDIRDFHAAILTDGSLPMAVLEAKIERWIESRR